MKYKRVKIIIVLLIMVMLSSCGKSVPVEKKKVTKVDRIEIEIENKKEKAPEMQAEAEDTQVEETQVPPEVISGNGITIVLDAGHQAIGNSDQEPIGPGATETKAKVTGGTSGCVSGLNEYELNLMVAIKLQEMLINRGYTVIMIRTTNEVDISNAQRAEIANSVNANAFIRIHANGSDNSNVTGIMTICQTPDNPYNASLYQQSVQLSTTILDNLVETTGAVREKVWETDTMSGINWAMVPCTIVEMGYMSNPEEDTLLASDDYQNKIALGIANGIDHYNNR